jgi:hypothetical protein
MFDDQKMNFIDLNSWDQGVDICLVAQDDHSKYLTLKFKLNSLRCKRKVFVCVYFATLNISKILKIVKGKLKLDVLLLEVLARDEMHFFFSQ